MALLPCTREFKQRKDFVRRVCSAQQHKVAICVEIMLLPTYQRYSLFCCFRDLPLPPVQHPFSIPISYHSYAYQLFAGISVNKCRSRHLDGTGGYVRFDRSADSTSWFHPACLARKEMVRGQHLADEAVSVLENIFGVERGTAVNDPDETHFMT